MYKRILSFSVISDFALDFALVNTKKALVENGMLGIGTRGIMLVKIKR